jgi:5-methylcytosine-specific restriction protein A
MAMAKRQPIRMLKPSVTMANLSPVTRLESKDAQSYGQGRGGRPWRRLRDEVLKRDRYMCRCEACRSCGLVTLADEVDHIVPLFEGGTDEPSNLRAINHDCHKLKTQAEAARASKR